MTTKAELEAELAQLKDQLKQRDAQPEKTVQEPETSDQGASRSEDGTLSGISDYLKTHGLGAEDLETLWAQVSTELDDFTTKKPLLTAVGAFGLGFVLGRMSKK